MGVVATRPALGRNASEAWYGCHEQPVGGLCFFGAVRLNPYGSAPVRVTSVRVAGVPRGVEVVSYCAVLTSEGSGSIGVGTGLPEREPGYTRIHPVTDVVVRGPRPEAWRVVVTLRITEPGEWETGGLDVGWRSGWRRGTAHLPYHFVASTLPQ